MSVTRGAFFVVKPISQSPARGPLCDFPPTHALRGGVPVVKMHLLWCQLTAVE